MVRALASFHHDDLSDSWLSNSDLRGKQAVPVIGETVQHKVHRASVGWWRGDAPGWRGKFTEWRRQKQAARSRGSGASPDSAGSPEHHSAVIYYGWV